MFGIYDDVVEEQFNSKYVYLCYTVLVLCYGASKTGNTFYVPEAQFMVV